jgi:hypothetical protein
VVAQNSTRIAKNLEDQSAERQRKSTGEHQYRQPHLEYPDIPTEADRYDQRPRHDQCAARHLLHRQRLAEEKVGQHVAE